jgi:NACHT domain
MSRLRTARPDHVAVATAAGAIAAAVVLALVLPGIGLKFVGALTGMAIGYVITKPARYLVMERATKKYRDFVTSDPTRLFPLKPDVEPKALGSRPRLTSSIAAHLAVRQPDPERGPIVVVGEAGSGKTTFAAGLAAQLAREAKAPVIVPLRGLGNEIDFDAVGRERFQQVVRRNRLARDADQLWNYLSSRERCVVIADGLDERVLESRAGDVTDATDEILSSEAARSVPLVITSRPDGLSRARLVEALELEELGEEYVAGLLVDDSKGSLGEEEAREITRQLELTLRPLYLTVARDICRRRERDALVQIAAQDTDLARYRLLDARLDVFMNDGDDTRSQTVDTISMLALIALREGEAQASTVQPDGLYEDWLQAIAGPRLDRPPLLAAAAGELRFLRIDGDRVGFRHPIIQTYLASRAMELLRGDARLRRDGRTDPEWGPLLKAGTSHEVLRALRMYATRLALSPGVEAGERMDLLTRDLIGHANTNYRNATHRLALLASAAQGLGSAATIRPDAFAEPRASLAELIAHTWDDKCDPATKIDAVRWLARMGGRPRCPACGKSPWRTTATPSGGRWSKR